MVGPRRQFSDLKVQSMLGGGVESTVDVGQGGLRGHKRARVPVSRR